MPYFNEYNVTEEMYVYIVESSEFELRKSIEAIDKVID